MWPDNETDRDFLNFSGVSDTVAEIIVQARGRPISIGVSGAWGIGKSSMIKLTMRSLAQRPVKDGERDFVFVEFNAWLYQGYDDARAALIDVIATKLEAEAKARERGIDKAKALLKRVNWLRAAKLAGTAAPMLFGLPPVGLAGEIWELGPKAFAGKINEKLGGDATKVAEEAASAVGGLLNPRADTSPPKEIQALRDTFEETLDELGVTLIVLIDDLDRCLPETTISTLEAIRLFLFLKNTAFVIAADNDMIKHAVRRHFEGVEDDLLVTNYFDKLIQVPIRVPPLGTQEVRAYMMLLFIENSVLEDDVKEKIRAGVCGQLRQTWQGKRVDRAFVQSLHDAFPAELIGRFDTADRLAPLMTTASGIIGNPRLIKRFLNALAIRMTISNAQGVGVDEAVLAKLFVDPSPGERPDICLVLTLRADFYGRALRSRPLSDALQTHVENLGPMTRSELEAAIAEPAKTANVTFEPGLVQTLLDDVERKPGSLPLLQFALREMWGRQRGGQITRDSYGDIGGVEGALAMRAEAIFSRLTGFNPATQRVDRPDAPG